MEKDFILTRVVTRDILRDWFASIRNMFGLRLRTYETMINENTVKLLEEMRLKYLNIKWYRISINPLSDKSVMLNVYGAYDD
jgi:hypothetical protein